MQHELSYLRYRAAQEREAAASATSERSRSIHDELARRYEEMLGASTNDAERVG